MGTTLLIYTLYTYNYIKGGSMIAKHESLNLRLLFTASYLTQCLAWMFFIGYLTMIGPPTLAVVAVFPTELAFVSQYFLYLSLFLSHNSWIAMGLTIWTGVSGALLYPKLLKLTPVDGFENSKQRYAAYAAVLHSCFALSLVAILFVIATEALLGPIDTTLERVFGSRYDFLIASWKYCWSINWESLSH